jgi:3'-5' exonuclease
MNSYTSRRQARLFFDIETGANPENCELMPDPVIEAPANYKDPAKIAEYIAEKTASAKIAQLEKAALDPDYGKILSIGYSTGKSMIVEMVGDVINVTEEEHPETGEIAKVEEYLSEYEMIGNFWDAYARCNGYAVGYNILGFDLPYLIRRSMALGLKVPVRPNLAKFRDEPITDLMMILYNWGSDRYKSLKQVARLYKIPNDCQGLDGSQVGTMDRETLRAYQANDVRMISGLYVLMNGVYFSH